MVVHKQFGILKKKVFHAGYSFGSAFDMVHPLADGLAIISCVRVKGKCALRPFL
jgi:hypothetical protein